MQEMKYKQVQIGPKSIEIPQEWGMEMAGELFKIRKDRVDPSELDEVVDLYSMPAFDEDKEPKKEETSEIGSKKYLVPDDTLLFPKLNIRKQRFWRVKRESETKGICSTEYWPLIPQEDLDLDFYNFYFRTHEFRSHPKVSSSSSTNSHKRVNQSSFEKVKLPVPPLPEQRRIAEILSTVDEAIQQTDEIIETSKELKKGLMQDLLTKGIGHEEFKEVQFGPKNVEIPTDWDHGYLRTLLEETQYGLNTSVNQQKGDYVLRVTDVASNGIIDFDSLQCSDLDESEKEKYRLQEQDLVIARSGATSGKVSIYEGRPENLFFSSYMIKMTPGEDLYGKYIFYILNSQFGQGQLMAGKQGSAQSNINTNSIERTGTPVPPLDEQREIVERLSVVDEKIRQEGEYREKLEELKKGLMQDLLTGEVRVEA